MDNLSLVILTSSKGHFGSPTYKEELEDLKRELGYPNGMGLWLRDVFHSRLAHIKVSDNANASEMAQYYSDNGVETIISNGDWKHYSQSNNIEHLKDLGKVFIDNYDKLAKYTLFLEDDFLIRPSKHNLYYWLNYAIEILEEQPQIFHVRFPRNREEFDRINNIKNTHPHIAWLQDRQAEWSTAAKREEYLYHNEFSFCPSITRTEMMRDAQQHIRNNFNRLSFQVEIGTEFAIKELIECGIYGPKTGFPFISFDSDLVRSVHLGEQNIEQLKKKYLYSNKE